MAILNHSILSSEPTNIVHNPVTISHHQLRDLVVCPEQRGLVNYVHSKSIMQRDVTNPASPPTPLVNLGFVPNTIASLQLPGSTDRLLAAGGQEAELHLSVHPRCAGADDDAPSPDRPHLDTILPGSINNSILLTSLTLARSHESAVEPRVVVSNNDKTVKFYDVAVLAREDAPPRISEVGALRFDVAVNHSSISPNGRTLLSVGDSPHVYLHALTAGARITFQPLMTLTLPSHAPFSSSPYLSSSSVSGPASFSTAFSACGTKFAVASQEGLVVVWDVRSTKPLKVYHTDRTRPYVASESWDWANGENVPGWGVRNVKFSPAGHGGKEIMTFTEHTSLLHVVDATTFETEEIVRVPSLVSERPSAPTTTPSESRRQLSRAGVTRHFDYAHRTPSTATISPARAVHIRRQRSRDLMSADDPAHDFDYDCEVEPPVAVLSYFADRVARVVRGPEYERPLFLRPYRVGVAGAEEGMNVDEPECASRAPSRAPSPPPTGTSQSPALSSWRHPRAHGHPGGPLHTTVPEHLNIAGTCFDPEGRFVYVASSEGIVEWGVRGAEKRWWGESAWV
ncbi:hypothetical protein K488DRAFT_83697 [Vararia minispora EC-137]|uniref:Uncharacterized protein n=1 Tax=Vararia minispora EC-137 TaxID=1314806 RepID=A0ACB8QT00_9AGAM|nr:hypothetical protein K488DRAFT_83697 [Vararia minispora EC-137]